MNYEERINFVKSDEYLNWLITFTKQNPKWCDDSFLYNQDISQIDYTNSQLLSYFYHYVAEAANEQNLFGEYDEDDLFYIFKLKDKYYKIYTIIGQGAYTTIEQIDYQPDIYTVLDEKLTDEEIFDNELIEYIVINKDLIDKIAPAKIGVHIGHACTICAIEEGHTDKFKKWYQNSKIQKKIILRASTKELEKLEADFYSVRDLGLTEVDENTLIAVSLGIMRRKDAKKYIKRLQLWK